MRCRALTLRRRRCCSLSRRRSRRRRTTSRRQQSGAEEGFGRHRVECSQAPSSGEGQSGGTAAESQQRPVWRDMARSGEIYDPGEDASSRPRCISHHISPDLVWPVRDCQSEPSHQRVLGSLSALVSLPLAENRLKKYHVQSGILSPRVDVYRIR